MDNGSSYTDDLVALLDALHVSMERLVPSEIDLNGRGLFRYGGIILSGRRRNDRLVNRVNSVMVRYAVGSGTKLLGICYGAEILALSLGGSIRRSDTPQKNVHGSVRISGETLITPDVGSVMDVFESHEYEIYRLPPVLAAVADSAGCRYEIVRHRRCNVYGTQFHPEMSRDGHDLVARFCMM